jgi:hypothetical protein
VIELFEVWFVEWSQSHQGVLRMCDYSLEHTASRPAKVGDRLVTRQCWNTNTRGFGPLNGPPMAVCLLPGTEISFDTEVRRELTGFQLIFGRHKAVVHHTVARFRQINLDSPFTHHDALEFPDGEIVLLTHLRAGQRATVLQLPASEAPSHREANVAPIAPERATAPLRQIVSDGRKATA